MDRNKSAKSIYDVLFFPSLLQIYKKGKKHCFYVWLILSVIKTVLTNVMQWKHLNAKASKPRVHFFSGTCQYKWVVLKVSHLITWAQENMHIKGWNCQQKVY